MLEETDKGKTNTKRKAVFTFSCKINIAPPDIASFVLFCFLKPEGSGGLRAFEGLTRAFVSSLGFGSSSMIIISIIRCLMSTENEESHDTPYAYHFDILGIRKHLRHHLLHHGILHHL